MRLARYALLPVLMLATLLPARAAIATTVSTINLPSGTWDLTVSVTGKDANNGLGFGMSSPQTFQICPTGEESDCTPGDSHTFTGVAGGEYVFYLDDFQCEAHYLSTDPNSAQIDQSDPTDWTIGWDDAGDCTTRDGDFNDLKASVSAVQSNSVDETSGDYNGTDTLDIATVFGTTDKLASEVIVPPGFSPAHVTDDEHPAGDFPGFCGGRKCDAQVDETVLPDGTSADNPMQIKLSYRGRARRGNAVYAQGDGESSPTLLQFCDSSSVARVGGTPAKCIASIKMKFDKIKIYTINIPNSTDPLCGKH